MAHEPTSPLDAEWTIDELAARSGVPARTIREYQRLGLVPSPRRVGRMGLYGPSHLRRLHLIGRLQDRGYSLAGIGDLLAAWRDGAALTDVLGIEPDQLVHVDEPGAPATLAQLHELLPSLVPEYLDALVDCGLVEHCGPDRHCVPSPSLLQLTIDLVDAGLGPDATLAALRTFGRVADDAASAVLDAMALLPDSTSDRAVAALVERGRGLVAHGLGRLTIHRLGRRIGATGSDVALELARRIRQGDTP